MGLVFKGNGWRLLGVWACCTLALGWGVVLAIFGSYWNFHGGGGVIFTVNEYTVYFGLTSPCWNKPCLASCYLHSYSLHPKRIAYMECVEYRHPAECKHWLTVNSRGSPHLPSLLLFGSLPTPTFPHSRVWTLEMLQEKMGISHSSVATSC